MPTAESTQAPVNDIERVKLAVVLSPPILLSHLSLFQFLLSLVITPLSLQLYFPLLPHLSSGSLRASEMIIDGMLGIEQVDSVREHEKVSVVAYIYIYIYIYISGRGLTCFLYL